MNLKSHLADIKLFVLNKLHWLKLFLKDLIHDLKLEGNYDLRIFVFVLIYVLFSVVGAYNFAHLTAFIYIIWLLEEKHGN